jgi:hypothetical protein
VAIPLRLKSNTRYDGGLLWQEKIIDPAEERGCSLAVSFSDLSEEFSLRTNIEVATMALWNVNKIDRVWNNILKYEGEPFYTVTNIEYRYVVKDNYILVNDDPRRRISKANFEKALEIVNPTPSKINLRGQSYIYGIITDSRIL